MHTGLCGGPPQRPALHPFPSGVIPIAHNSGGPKADIVVPAPGPDGPEVTGFLAETPEDYCDAITRVLVMSQVRRAGGRLSQVQRAGGA